MRFKRDPIPASRTRTVNLRRHLMSKLLLATFRDHGFLRLVPMQPAYALAFSILVATSAAQTPAPPAAQPEPQIEIRKAIPVAEDVPPAAAAVPPIAKIVYTRCEVPAPVIAITFDDGPNPDTTPRLLDMLKERNIKATFFMVGRCVVTYPQIVKRIADEGHEVANHSWSHPLLTSLGTTSVESQLRRTHDAIVKACGKAPTHYRPPYGEARFAQRKRIQETFGYSTILWDVDPLDWQHPRASQKVHDRILAQTKSGSIILCHDIHETTVAAMPSTLDDLKARGYQFATVSQLIELEAESAKPETPIAIAPSSATPAAVPPSINLGASIPLTVPTETKP